MGLGQDPARHHLVERGRDEPLKLSDLPARAMCTRLISAAVAGLWPRPLRIRETAWRARRLLLGASEWCAARAQGFAAESAVKVSILRKSASQALAQKGAEPATRPSHGGRTPMPKIQPLSCTPKPEPPLLRKLKRPLLLAAAHGSPILVPGLAAIDERDHRKHDRDLNQYADNRRKRRTGLKTAQADRGRNSKLKEVG